MAHYAQLNENNVVTQVIVVHNNELVISKQTVVNEDSSISVRVTESEANGIAFCKSIFGDDTNWVQTSYNGSFRGKYAGIGDTYDPVTNLFVSPVVESDPVVEALQTADIPMLTTDDIQAISSVDISALNTSDLQSLTTTGL
jgi:hypothetical protein